MVKTFSEYNKAKSVSEGFFDWLTGKSEDGEAKQKGHGEPDVEDAEVTQFYQTLQDFANSGKSIPVQTKGNMSYSKMVEDIQAALVFLGYPLARFGVDGLFGPETAAAIQKFNNDTVAKTQA
jgi:peptidoglycan hydrolase-like protein with peptidoglycan-binding domain